jgi:hypothetical protein
MKNQDKGFVSLFTCIMISLLLMVITMSVITLENLQLRKAEDSEQSLRAYYAAESGVEDGIAKVLKQAVTTDQPCTSSVASGGFDTLGEAEWTCQRITFSGTPTGKLDDADSAKTIDTGDMSANPYKSVVIEWNQSTDPNLAYYKDALGASGVFPSEAAYNANPTTPPLEIAMVEYPNAGFKASDVCTSTNQATCNTKLQNMVIVPNGLVNSDIDYGNLLGHGPWSGNCAPLGRTYGVGGKSGYNCYAVITNLPSGKNFLYRIRSRYSSSGYRMTFMSNPNGNGSVVPVPDGMATIDVTAKAGDAYRRVISKLPLNKGAASGLNFVIYSDSDVCKNFDVIDNVPPASTGC